MNTIKIYGLSNCDVTKKTLKYFEANDIVVEFHNYKAEGISEQKLKDWFEKKDWTLFVNKRGTTWKALDYKTQESISNERAAIDILTKHTSIIKRPVIETESKLIIGFDEKVIRSLVS